jgi:hypothetical protein
LNPTVLHRLPIPSITTSTTSEKQGLEQDLAKAPFVVEVQEKLHALLETLSESADTDPRSTP